MEFIMTVLFIGGNILLKAILLFLMAVPSGMGLGVGLHIIKSLFKKKDRKGIKSSKERVKHYADIETAVASSKI